MRRKILTFEIETEDIGATQALTVKLGDTEIGRWYAHTRYADRSLDDAEADLAKALVPFVALAMEGPDGKRRERYTICSECGADPKADEIEHREHSTWCSRG